MALLSFTGSPHGGRQRHLPEWQSQPKIKPTTIIDHSIVGSAEGAWQMFRDRSVLESHFIVDLNGEIWQLMDTDREADANLNANAYAISIETADRGDPNTQPWTAEQLASLAWLHEALLAAHPSIPRRRSRSCSDPAGLGYHTLHGAPSCWTPVAKSCPGAVRKRQWFDVVLPAFLNPEETEMPLDQADKDWLEKLAENVARRTVHAVMTGGTGMWANPDRPGWEFYKPEVQAAALAHLRDALIVPGTTNPDEAYELLFARVRNIEDVTAETVATTEAISAKLDAIAAALPDPAEPPPAP
jgi:hypothetical protein